MPNNRWDIQTPPACFMEEGYDVGQIAPDMRMTDQHGDTVSLWQFYGSVVVIDLYAMWSLPAVQATREGERSPDALMEQHEGLTVLTLITERAYGYGADADDLRDWANTLSQAAPVVSDDERHHTHFITDHIYPKTLLIDRNMQFIDVDVQDLPQALDVLLAR
ncbi:MAG: redoxin domain-containing protein [Myxococcota bacterium]